ncbi:MAG: hypothetical protein JSU92_06605 [Deltaproteobacteria bacterium]|nr:MAG: hypothetical protein JSU92_06605 [Deltaproteobacteria bacterium]
MVKKFEDTLISRPQEIPSFRGGQIIKSPKDIYAYFAHLSEAGRLTFLHGSGEEEPFIRLNELIDASSNHAIYEEFGKYLELPGVGVAACGRTAEDPAYPQLSLNRFNDNDISGLREEKCQGFFYVKEVKDESVYLYWSDSASTNGSSVTLLGRDIEEVIDKLRTELILDDLSGKEVLSAEEFSQYYEHLREAYQQKKQVVIFTRYNSTAFPDREEGKVKYDPHPADEETRRIRHVSLFDINKPKQSALIGMGSLRGHRYQNLILVTTSKISEKNDE